MVSRNYCRKAFFEQRAETWDAHNEHDGIKLLELFEALDLHYGDSIVDVGTGTGILIPHILQRIGQNGKILAIDYAKNMIEQASEKFPPKDYPNVEFLAEDYLEIEPESLFDAVVCYSCFPHLADKNRFFRISFEMLKSGGTLFIAHSDSRRAINEMHARKHESVCDDFMPIMKEIADMGERTGFAVIDRRDDERIFYILMIKR